MLILNTKTSEVKNKMLGVSGLIRKTNYDAKILEIDEKYITTSDYNKFRKDIIDGEMKQKELANKSDNSYLIRKSDLEKPCKIRNKNRIKSRAR